MDERVELYKACDGRLPVSMILVEPRGFQCRETPGPGGAARMEGSLQSQCSGGSLELQTWKAWASSCWEEGLVIFLIRKFGHKIIENWVLYTSIPKILFLVLISMGEKKRPEFSLQLAKLWGLVAFIGSPELIRKTGDESITEMSLKRSD